MLTTEELCVLESLLTRAKDFAAPSLETIAPGDLVQLRPGSCSQWGTSFLLVGQVRDTGELRGTILRPHRGGWRDAWYRYSPPEVARIGRSLYPEPPIQIQGASYWPACPSCHNLERAKRTRKPKRRAK